KVSQTPFVGKFYSPRAVAFAPDGRTVAAGVADGSVRICEVASGRQVHRFADEGMANQLIISLSFSPSRRLIAVGFRDHSMVSIWDVGKGERVHAFRWGPLPDRRGEPDPKHEPGIYKLAFTPDGNTLAINCADGKLRLYEVTTKGLR